jgi:hypothetical protein
MACQDRGQSLRPSDRTYWCCRCRRILRRWGTNGLMLVRQDCQSLGREDRATHSGAFERPPRLCLLCGILSRWKENCFRITVRGCHCLGHRYRSSYMWALKTSHGSCSHCGFYAQLQSICLTRWEVAVMVESPWLRGRCLRFEDGSVYGDV